MPAFPLQSSNVFSYTFAGAANTHTHYLFVANNAGNSIMNIGGQSWTIECWLKPQNRGVNGLYAAIFSKRRANGPNNGVDVAYLGYINGTDATIRYYDGTDYNSGRTLTPNSWHHIAYVFNQGSNVRIFLNGTNILTSAVTSVANIDSAFHIGFNPGQTTQYFGDISNFRVIRGQAIYSGNFGISNYPFQLPNNAIGAHAGTTNVAASLTGNVILLTCNDDAITIDGNNKALLTNNLFVSGTVYPHAVDATELQNFSYQFYGNTIPGQNGSVLVTNTTNSLNLNTDFTIETWYYPTTNSGVLLERGYGGVGNNSASYILIWDSPNNNLNFAVANANNNTYTVGALTGSAGSLGAPTLNAWNHIAVTRAGNSYRGFLNGNLNFNTTNANTPYAALGRGLTIGGMFNNGQTYATGIPANTISGYISNMRIISGNSIYNAAFTVSNTSQLLNVTNTVLLTGMSPAFEDISGTHTIAQNGMNQITFSTFSPIRANSQTNSTSGPISYSTNAVAFRLSRVYNKFDYTNFGQYANIRPAQTIGQRQVRIYNKFDYSNFSQMINIYPAVAQEQGRIYNKFDYANFAALMNIYTAVGDSQGRIYAKQLTATDYAYIPVGGGGGAGTGNVEYQFWS